jgi:hypothetical protein
MPDYSQAQRIVMLDHPPSTLARSDNPEETMAGK